MAIQSLFEANTWVINNSITADNIHKIYIW